MGFFVVIILLTWRPGAAVGETELLVSAAVSLTDSFKEIGKAYEAENPGVMVRFNFGAYGSLQQIEQGAPLLISLPRQTSNRWIRRKNEA